MPGEGAPGWVWWSDRAVRRTPASGASATGPVSREVALAPSHRADEPPSPRAPGKQVHLVHADRKDCSGRGARVRCPGASVLRLSPPLVALSFTCWSLDVIGSGQSHPVSWTQAQGAWQRPKSHRSRGAVSRKRYGGARVTRDSPSNVAACHCVVRRHTRSPVTRRSTRATPAQAAPRGHVGQPVPKTPSKESHETRSRLEE